MSGSISSNPRIQPSQQFSEALDFTLGSVNITGNSTHLAIKDESFLKVADRNNQTYLARPSTLQLDNEGYLTLNSGHRILDNNDQPILVQVPGEPGGASIGEIKISPSGVITNGRSGDVIATLGVFNVADRNSLRPQNGGLYSFAQQGVTPTATNNIVQGAQEQSNVNPTVELINMISTQRSFQADTRALTTLARIKEAYVSAFAR